MNNYLQTGVDKRRKDGERKEKVKKEGFSKEKKRENERRMIMYRS